jgi:hypothetical protein
MSRRNRLIRQLEARWFACYGEPPPIRTDPELMLAVMDADVASEAAAAREAAALEGAEGAAA